MKVGEPITVYTHEMSDQDHSVNDQAALVTGVVDDTTLDVVIFPRRGPVTFSTLRPFDPNGPLPQVGATYWREAGSEPPDFKGIYDPWFEMLARQRKEMAEVEPSRRDALLKEQDLERRNFSMKGKAEPEPEPEREPLVRRSSQPSPTSLRGAAE